MNNRDWEIERIKTFEGDKGVAVVVREDYLLQTWGSMLLEIWFDKEGKEISGSRKLISLKKAKKRFPYNEYLLSLKSSEDLPDYGNDWS